MRGETFILILVSGLTQSVAQDTETKCSESVVSPSCAQELRPSLQDLAGNATMLSADLTLMTITNFLNLLSDTSLRQILLEAVQNSIQFAAAFSINSLEGDPAGLRRTILIGLLDLADQFIDITKNFMENDAIAKRMSSVLVRLENMSHSGEEVLRKLGKTSLRTFAAFTTIDTALAVMVRCFDPEKIRDGCSLLLDTKKFVISHIRRLVDQ